MEDKKEELIFRKHMEELAKSAYFKRIKVYTDFLNLNELSILKSMERTLSPVGYSLYGGCEGAERVMACFHGDEDLAVCREIIHSDFYADYPISCLKISPANAKFAENLTHRDFLGAILNLGIDRSKTGDILIKEKDAYLYCDTMIASFISEQLIRIRHTTVRCSFSEESNEQMHNFEEIHATVSSLRLDAILSAAFHSSRSGLTGLIAGGKVFVNGREILSNSYMLKENDTVSVRGYGKFIFRGQGALTKKGRICVTIDKYI